MSLEALMDKIVSLERKQPVQGRVGGENPPKFLQDPDAVEVMCSIQPANASTKIDYMQRDVRISHSIYFEKNWNPNTGDRWVAGNRAYIVEGWYESLEIEDTWTCDCMEVRLPSPKQLGG